MGFWILAGLLATLPAWASEPPPPGRRAALVELVRQDCGSCHGLTLKGGLGPSLEATALVGKDAEALGFVILHGRRGTPMPPWRDHLTESEARWIVEQLQKGFPE
ncbi:MAG TPA: cytochrome c [Burkholderiales bacterium]|nr:cytochrome c [Burkholderiales bacterium]